MSADRAWFIGDSVIVRYDDEQKVRVRITSSFHQTEQGVKLYRVNWIDDDGNVGKFTEWRNLAAAIRCGEEWLP